MTQTTLRSFISPTEFDGDDALQFPSTNGIHSVVLSSGTGQTIALSTQTRYIVVNGTVDFWMNIGSTTVSASIPSSTVTDGSGPWLVKYQGGCNQTFFVGNNSGAAFVSSASGTVAVGCYTD